MPDPVKLTRVPDDDLGEVVLTSGGCCGVVDADVERLLALCEGEIAEAGRKIREIDRRMGRLCRRYLAQCPNPLEPGEEMDQVRWWAHRDMGVPVFAPIVPFKIESE